MLRHDLTRPLLVITGSWNPAIVNPSWVGRHLFQKPEGQEIAVIEVALPEARPPIFYIEEFGFSASQPRIDFFLNSFNSDSVARLEELVLRLLEILPHTPITAVGLNYIFEVEGATRALLDKFQTQENIERAFRVIERVFVSRIDLGDGVRLNLRRQLSLDRTVLDLNFHQDVTEIEKIRAIISGGVEAYFERALEVIERLYNERQVDHRGHQFPSVDEAR